MVGKIKHVRQKLHQEAVKLERPETASQPATTARLKPPALELQRKTTPEENVAEAPKQVCFRRFKHVEGFKAAAG